MHPNAVAESNVNARARLIDVASAECDQPNSQLAHRGFAELPGRHEGEAMSGIDPQSGFPVDEQISGFGIRRIAGQRSERANVEPIAAGANGGIDRGWSARHRGGAFRCRRAMPRGVRGWRRTARACGRPRPRRRDRNEV